MGIESEISTAMSALGEQLKQVRESKNISLAQVAEETKIRLDHLEAIESGRYDVFAAPVYARGSLRTYVRLLKLDEEAAMEQMKAEMEPDKPRGFLKKLSFDRAGESPFKSSGKSKSKPAAGKKGWFGSSNEPEDSSDEEPIADPLADIPVVDNIPDPAPTAGAKEWDRPETRSPFSGPSKAEQASDLQGSLPFQSPSPEPVAEPSPGAPTKQDGGQRSRASTPASFAAKERPTGRKNSSRDRDQAAASPKTAPKKQPSRESEFEAMARRAAMRNWILGGAVALLVLVGVIFGDQWFRRSNVDQAELGEALKELGDGLYLPADHENDGVTLALPAK